MSMEPAVPRRFARLPWIDAARGIAIVAMVIYHFSWDLRFFGFTDADVTGSLGWKLFARSIAGSFLALVGVSLVLAAESGFDHARYLRRLAVIALAAAGITVVTWFVTPDAYVFFGILHCIAVASVVGLPFVWTPVWFTVAAAVLAFALPSLVSAPVFDAPWLVWLGLGIVPPRSNDFVPLFPWLGTVLVGIAAARATLDSKRGAPLLGRLRRPAPAALVRAGRWSLVIYLVHQPVLFGLVALAAKIAPPSERGFETSFVESCTASCIEAGLEADICRATCSCIVDETQVEGLWAGLMRQRLSEDERRQYMAIAEGCRNRAEGAPQQE
jgi:uncharacterized membrane protein